MLTLIRMRLLIPLIILCCMQHVTAAAAPIPSTDSQVMPSPTVLTTMRLLQTLHGIHFVYDSSLHLGMPYTGPDIRTVPLRQALALLFTANGIEYRLQRHNVILRKADTPVVRADKKAERHDMLTIGGRITDSDGEPMVNATVFDLVSKEGTLSDHHGRYLLHLSEGRHRLRVSSLGCGADTLDIHLRADCTHDFRLSQAAMLAEVVVTENLNSPMLTTQTGKRTFTQEDINNGFAMLSSPDLIKTMQRTSGVSAGVDLISGLYVHGGGSDENLFLLDGTPLYQTNHSLGLFSAFNSDIIKSVDFYKSGFPARYSGRISSITDVYTRDGNMQKVHGTVSLGLLDGRIQVEGPIRKDRTSFNISLRRSWIDLLMKPALAIVNSGNDDKYKLDYMFHDLNMKLTHRHSSRTTLWASLYSGHDSYGVDDKSRYDDNVSDTDNRMSWGNVSLTLGTDMQASRTLSVQAMLTGTYSHSRQKYSEDDYDIIDGNAHRRNFLDLLLNRSQMFDLAARADLNWRPANSHHLHGGLSLTRHQFRPQTIQQSFYYGDKPTGSDTTYVRSHTNTVSYEATAYVEDEMRFGPRLSADFGTSLTITAVNGRTYCMPDPRFAMKWQMSPTASLKLSYTHMSQSIHRIASSFLELPTDFWVPTTDEIKPSQSHQLAVGVYSQPSHSLTLSLEAYYKRSSHILQYRHWMGFQPSATTWTRDVADGRGKAYGIEADATYSRGSTTMSLAYTLSWSQRLFKDIYPTWFDDQFDNRHKLNLSLKHDFTSHASVYAAWTYHSGNRVTMPIGYALQPPLPHATDYTYGYIFDRPNNYRLPSYHRLDVGANFTRTTRRGHERTWNVSIYNAYCHLNTMYVKVWLDDDNHFRAKSRGFIPIIPSVSYTLRF